MGPWHPFLDWSLTRAVLHMITDSLWVTKFHSVPWLTSSIISPTFRTLHVKPSSPSVCPPPQFFSLLPDSLMCNVGMGYGPGLGTLDAAILVPVCGCIYQGSQVGQNQWMILIYLFHHQGWAHTMIPHHRLERMEVANDSTAR